MSDELPVIPTVLPSFEVVEESMFDVALWTYENAKKVPWPATTITASIPVSRNDDGTGEIVDVIDFQATRGGGLAMVNKGELHLLDPAKLLKLKGVTA